MSIKYFAIPFDSDSAALAWLISIESRIGYVPGREYLPHTTPSVHMTDGRKVIPINLDAEIHLTHDEAMMLVGVDASLIPADAPCPVPPPQEPT